MGGLVGEERMEFREEQAEVVRKKGEEEEEKQVLAALALFGEIIADQCQQKLKGNQDVNRIAEMETLKINETAKINELYREISEIPETEKEKNVNERKKVEEECEAMGGIGDVQRANQTDQLEAFGFKMKSEIAISHGRKA